MKMVRLKDGESLVIGDPSKDNCVILRAKRKSEFGISVVDRNTPILIGLHRISEYLKQTEQEPSQHLQDHIREIERGR